jgi:hypothetical protein
MQRPFNQRVRGVIAKPVLDRRWTVATHHPRLARERKGQVSASPGRMPSDSRQSTTATEECGSVLWMGMECRPAQVDARGDAERGRRGRSDAVIPGQPSYHRCSYHGNQTCTSSDLNIATSKHCRTEQPTVSKPLFCLASSRLRPSSGWINKRPCSPTGSPSPSSSWEDSAILLTTSPLLSSISWTPQNDVCNFG